MRLKLLPFVGGLILCASVAHAVSSAYDPIRTPLPATTVSVSTSAWTAIPATDTAGRTLVHFSNPASNSGAMSVIASTSPTIPGEAITIRPHEYQPGEGDWFHIYGVDIYWYAVSLHTSAESLHVQEYKQ